MNARTEWGASDASKVTAVPWGQGALSSGTTWAASRPRIVSGLQHQAVAGAWVPAGDAPAQRAAPARQGEKPEPGGILRLGDAGLPIALAEGQQDRRIGDPGAVVGEGNAGTIAVLLDGRGNAVGPATP